MTIYSTAAVLAAATALITLPALTRRLRGKGRSRQVSGFFWTACALSLVLAMIVQPKIAFDGATTGLKAWWNIVFPSLLPFFIASELLMSYGLVNFMGILLEPVMRPLFNVPGCGAFVLCIGYTSGFPIGAMVTARLRSQKMCTRIEAERLISFTNNSSPLFMVVAVSVGMFGRPDLGLVIAGSHYLANLTLGIMLRFYGKDDREALPQMVAPGGGLISRAFRELGEAWQRESRPPGKIIGDATRNAVGNLLNIGGFIILFAVIIKLLTAAGLIAKMSSLIGSILIPLGFSAELMPALASGFFEMTIGSKMASESSAPLIQQLAAAGAILAWSGLSVHAQVASMISDTDIRMLPFVCTRIAHAILAFLYTMLIFGPGMPAVSNLAVPAMAMVGNTLEMPPAIAGLALSFISLIVLLGLLLVLSFIITAIKRIRIIF